MIQAVAPAAAAAGGLSPMTTSALIMGGSQILGGGLAGINGGSEESELDNQKARSERLETNYQYGMYPNEMAYATQNPAMYDAYIRSQYATGQPVSQDESQAYGESAQKNKLMMDQMNAAKIKSMKFMGKMAVAVPMLSLAAAVAPGATAAGLGAAGVAGAAGLKRAYQQQNNAPVATLPGNMADAAQTRADLTASRADAFKGAGLNGLGAVADARSNMFQARADNRARMAGNVNAFRNRGNQQEQQYGLYPSVYYG